jgi:two-component system nitrate/nitrite response regulator NarL
VPPVTLLIVDDHRIFAEVLRARLESEPRVSEVRLASGLDEALQLAGWMSPDVVVLDYDVDGVPATGLIGDLRALTAPPEVVMLSGSEDPDDIIASLSAGAAAWVVKGARVEDLMAALEEVLDGHAYLHPTTLRPVLDRLLHQHDGDDDEPNFLQDLSARQLEVLRCLAGGLTRAETAQRLFISPNTVRTHVQHLLTASGEHSTLALVARARELGVPGIDAPSEDGPSSSG